MIKNFVCANKLYSILIFLLFLPCIAFSVTSSPFIEHSNEIQGTYLVGLTNLECEVENIQLPVQGEVPEWLQGKFFKNGPAKFYEKESYISNWLDGLAMIHLFSIKNGHVVYTNKFLKSDQYNKVSSTHRMDYEGFSSKSNTPMWKKAYKWVKTIFVPQLKPINNANVSFTLYKGLGVFSEVPCPVAIDENTLETVGPMYYEDILPQKNTWESAHPHFDYETNQYINYFIQYGKKSTYNFYTINKDSLERKIITSIAVDAPAYMHTFATTERYIILVEFPFVVNVLSLLLSGKPFINNLEWKPERGTQFTVIEKKSGAIVRTYKADAFFAFHHVNAYEDGSNIIVDTITYPTAEGIFEAAQFDTIFARHITPHMVDDYHFGTLWRYALDMQNGEIAKQQVSQCPIEMPQMHYTQYNGKQYRYMYAVSFAKERIPYASDSLVKIDVCTGEVLLWHEDHCYTSEPIFVPNPTGQKEDDGVVLSVILDAKAGKSYLLILDAETFTEVARAFIPHHIPFSIHGLFVAEDATYAAA